MKILISNHRSNIDGFNPPDPKRERQVRLKPWAKLEQKQTQPTTNVLSFYILYQWITYKKKYIYILYQWITYQKKYIYILYQWINVCVLSSPPPTPSVFLKVGENKTKLLRICKLPITYLELFIGK